MDTGQEQPFRPGRKRRRTIVLATATTVLVLGIGAFTGWFLGCPCEFTPGGYLLGEEVEEPVRDWSFVNEEPLCQIQVRTPLLPHSVNLNCMATDTGRAYLSCSSCDGKRWSDAAREDGSARLRVGDEVYPVTVTRITTPAEKDRAWQARLEKLAGLAQPGSGTPPGSPRPPDSEWWTFHVESRTP